MAFRTPLFLIINLLISLAFAQRCCAQTMPAVHTAPPTSPAQAAPAATTASMMVTVYQRYDRASPGPVSIDQIEDDSDKFEARNPPEAELLFALLQQGSRSQIAPVPPVDAEYMIERDDPAASYAVSRHGVVWAAGTAYQLSKGEFKSLKSLVEKIKQSADIIDGQSLWSTGDNGIPKHLDKAIVVVFFVDARGKTSHTRIVKSCGDKRFDDAACDAVLQHSLPPPMHDGVPVPGYYRHIFVVDDQSH